MALTSFDDSWKFWIWDNVRRGSSKREIAQILPSKNFDKQLIINEFGIPDILDEINPENFAPEFCLERLVTEYGAKRVSDDLQVYEIYNFLNESECDQMIELIKNNCKRSSVIEYETGGNAISDFRTSSTANLYRKMGEVVSIVEEKLNKFSNIPEKFTEQVQGQYYQVGQQFKPHFDTLFPTSEIMKQAITKSGNRTWTAMIYLNNVEEGGETKFTKIDLTTKPERGKLLIWQNTKNGVNIENSMHWGMPVIKGEKFVLTKWFREKVYQNI